MVKNITSFDSIFTCLDYSHLKQFKIHVNDVTWGSYLLVGEKLVVIFFEGERLMMTVATHLFHITENTSAKIDEVDTSKKLFKLFENENLLVEFEYTLHDPHYKIPPFEYLDEEQYDWGLFISNIINNHARQSLIIENNV